MNKGIVTLIGVVGLATVASAQSGGTYMITSSNVVDKNTPSTTIEIWAIWTGPDYLFLGGTFDLTAGDGTFGNENNIIMGPGTTAGVAAGNVVTGAVLGQIHIPSLGPLFEGDPANPLLLGSYSWTTTDFTARTVPVDTSNTVNFLLGLIETGATLQLFPGEFTAGSGSIEVIPAPSALALLGLGGLVAARRRR